ncbi:OLC1v1011423C3 [Oldenlandia corymbosa var. corymbosa]|nr:OLC1v1011423C3 [Oldenlandia corymbosa var. corymbosa]
MVQFLTDLELVISKSYICSDGGWLMDVFHVTDQKGKKIRDEGLINHIQQAFGTGKEVSKELQLSLRRNVRPTHISSEHTALEMTAIDRPGLMSEISAVLAEMGCHISAAVVWTHNSRSACILYVADDSNGAPITDPCRVARVQAQLESVVEAHHVNDEKRSVRLASPPSGKTHTERRLHQLMEADRDYEACCFSCCEGIPSKDVEFYPYGKCDEERLNQCDATHVKVENCKEKGYSIITVRSRDRPKLLFDTVCALTDMQYIVFHAAVSSKGSRAFQEYYVRHKRGCTLELEAERRRLIQCLIAATERRVSHGIRLDVRTQNRLGLLSDITRVFRENGLSITRAEIGSIDDRAVGTFYVKDTSGQTVSGETLEMVKKEIGGTILVIDKSVDEQPETTHSNPSGDSSSSSSNGLVERRTVSFGSVLWSQLERLSSNFKPIKS